MEGVDDAILLTRYAGARRTTIDGSVGMHTQTSFYREIMWIDMHTRV